MDNRTKEKLIETICISFGDNIGLRRNLTGAEADSIIRFVCKLSEVHDFNARMRLVNELNVITNMRL